MAKRPFCRSWSSLLDKLSLSAEALQTEAILVNLPSLNFIAALLLAELHGRMGYFPPVLRLRPAPGSLPPQYEVAEILNLQNVRDSARGSVMTDERIDLLACVLELRPRVQEAVERDLPHWWGRGGPCPAAGQGPGCRPRPGGKPACRGGRPPLYRFQPDGEISRQAARPAGGIPAALYGAGCGSVRQTVGGRPTGRLFQPGKVVELDHIPFEVSAVYTDGGEDPWAGRTSYAALSAAHLLAGQAPARKIHLLFTSPTVFKSNDIQVPLPLPALVFGSLLAKWNRFAPVAMPEETRRYAEKCLAVSAFTLRSCLAGTKAEGVRSGAVGEVSYATLNADRYWMSLAQALAAYAFYAGVGAGTTMGMGQCRPSPRSGGRRNPEG